VATDLWGIVEISLPPRVDRVDAADRGEGAVHVTDLDAARTVKVCGPIIGETSR